MRIRRRTAGPVCLPVGATASNHHRHLRRDLAWLWPRLSIQGSPHYFLCTVCINWRVALLEQDVGERLRGCDSSCCIDLSLAVSKRRAHWLIRWTHDNATANHVNMTKKVLGALCLSFSPQSTSGLSWGHCAASCHFILAAPLVL